MLRRKKNHIELSCTPWCYRNSNTRGSIKDSPLAHGWELCPESWTGASSYSPASQSGHFFFLRPAPLGEDECTVRSYHFHLVSAMPESGRLFSTLMYPGPVRVVVYRCTKLFVSPSVLPPLVLPFLSSCLFIQPIPLHSCWQIIYLLRFHRQFK